VSNEKKAGNTEATMLGLPEVPANTNSTQEMDQPVAAPTHPGLEQVTAPSLAPVRTNLEETMPPRRLTGAGIPQAQPAPRKSRVMATQPIVEPTTDPTAARAAEQTQVTPPKSIEWTMPRVAGLSAGVAIVFVLTWVFWPSGHKAPRPSKPTIEDTEPVAEAPVPKKAAPVAAVPVEAPKKPAFALDSKQNVIDPYAKHLDDLDLDPAHKYQLRIASDDSRLGTALARLDERAGWGVMRKMASHAALQFGGAKALRMHCEPGSHFTEGQVFPLELTDLATRKSIKVPLNPAIHCWDFEVTRAMDLGEGVKRRIRVPTDSKVKLGENVPLRIAYILEALGEQKQWRTGILSPGESVLAEGRSVRFAILDPYAGDNEGTVDLELLSGDTASSGLVTPSSASGAQFVPVGQK
jgi:hypothetical protein